MSDRAPYSRVYWSVMDDEKFDGIREDVRHFGAWSLLLIVADMAWPAPAYLPPTVPKSSINRLAGVELIDLLPGGRFRIHGLNNERGRRSDSARASATARHSQSERDANAYRTDTERNLNGVLDETRRDEHRRDETSNARDEPHIEAWLMVRHRLPTPRQQAFLDRYLSVFDVTGPQRMAQLILEHPDDPIAALKEDLDRHREERLAGLNGSTTHPRPKPKREPWQDLLRDKLAADEEALLERTRLPGVPS